MSYDPDAPLDKDPSEVIMAALAASAKGEPFDEDELEAYATLMVAAVLVDRTGLDIDTVVDLFEARDHEFLFSWADGQLSVTVNWDDGEPTELAAS